MKITDYDIQDLPTARPQGQALTLGRENFSFLWEIKKGCLNVSMFIFSESHHASYVISLMLFSSKKPLPIIEIIAKNF
jgi:hypothetical protein